ncbi:MAG: sigma-70 family RNA polymerase sigma factor [Verrucomicrobiales bacterium]|nr:sigma-70 family RNA polymerase sigma factor [Verrucomicrobiales bacterium]
MSEPHPFEAFLRAYQNVVYTTAFRLLGREAEAEDIAQEVFLKAYAHFDELASSPTAGGWLKTVTRNLALNHLTRYRNRWRFFSELEAEDEEGGDGFAARLPAPETHQQTLDTADQREALEAALQRLPAAQRVPLVLYHFDHLSYEEIAARLKVSLGKVKTDIHRARAALRRRLSAQEIGATFSPAAVSSSPKTSHESESTRAD